MHQFPKLKCFLSRLAVVFAQSIEARCYVENEDVVGAAPTGDAPTTSEWSSILLPTKVRLILETWRYSSSMTLFDIVQEINTFRLKQNGWHVADIFKCISHEMSMFWYKHHWFICMDSIDQESALVKVMAWYQIGDKQLPAPLLTKIYAVIWHHWAWTSQYSLPWNQ